ncbi:MAG: hypothetical protein V9G12_13025 [Microthrixaceae bacterium]
MLLEERERSCGVEAVGDHDVVPGEQAEQRPGQRTVVVHRTGHHEAPVPLDQQDGLGVGVEQRRVAVHDQLRTTGAAARCRRLPRRRHDVVVGGRVGERGVVGDCGTVPGGQRRTAGVDPTDDDGRTGELDDGVELGVGQLRRHRLGDGADHPAHDERLDELDAVAEGDRDEVARAGTEAPEAIGECCCLAVEATTVDAAPIVGDRDRCGGGRREVGEVSGEAHQRHRGNCTCGRPAARAGVAIRPLTYRRPL